MLTKFIQIQVDAYIKWGDRPCIIKWENSDLIEAFEYAKSRSHKISNDGRYTANGTLYVERADRFSNECAVRLIENQILDKKSAGVLNFMARSGAYENVRPFPLQTA